MNDCSGDKSNNVNEAKFPVYALKISATHNQSFHLQNG